MEPQLRNQESGLAPLVGWSSITPSLTTTPNKLLETTPVRLNSKTPPPPYHDTKCYPNGVPPILEVKFEDEMMSSSSLNSLRDYSDSEQKPKIPDGGWGWVVVLSSLIISMIADGISFSFGLLYIEFLHEFGASKSLTSWIGSLFMAVPLLTGPIMSALVDRYGCRNMTIVGGIVSALGFVLSTYATSISAMLLTFGVIAGLGLGLCYVTAVVSIAYWFDKKRSLAVGLGACGTGIGTFVYAPLTTYLIHQFGWRGTTLLLAGTFLNMCVCGTLMRDPEWIMNDHSKHGSLGKRSLKGASSASTVSAKSSIIDFPGLEEIRNILKGSQKSEYLLQTLGTTIGSPHDTIAPEDHFRSAVNLPTFVKQSETVPSEVLEHLSENKRLYNVILENYPSLLLCPSTSEKGKMAPDATVITARVPVTVSLKLKKAPLKEIKDLVKQQSLPEERELQQPLIANDYKNVLPPYSRYPGRSGSLPWLAPYCGPNARHYLKNIKLHKHSVMYRGAMLNIPKYRLRASSCPDIYRNSMTTLAQENEQTWYTDFVELLKNMVDFSLFAELHFLLMCMSTILLFTWFIVPYFYLADHLNKNNYSESEASFVLSMIGVTNTIGMVGLGWAGDQPWLNIKKTYAVCLILCGLSCIAIILSTNNYVMLVASSASFGLFFASNYSFTPALLVDLISLEKFTTAYGLILLCQGIGNLLGPPLAGLLFDLTSTWDQSFWQAGIWIVVAGIFIAFIPFTKNRKVWGTGALEKDLGSERVSMA